VWFAQIDQGGCVKQIVALGMSALLSLGLLTTPGTAAMAETPGQVSVASAITCFNYDGSPAGRITGTNATEEPVELSITYDIPLQTLRRTTTVPAGGAIDESIGLPDQQSVTLQVFADGVRILSESDFVNCSPPATAADGAAAARFSFHCASSGAMAKIDVDNRLDVPSDLRIAFQQGARVHDARLAAGEAFSDSFSSLADDVPNDVRITLNGEELFFLAFTADCTNTAPDVTRQTHCDNPDGDNTTLTLTNPNRRSLSVVVEYSTRRAPTQWVPKWVQLRVPAYGTSVVPLHLEEDDPAPVRITYDLGGPSGYTRDLPLERMSVDCFGEWTEAPAPLMKGPNEAGTTLTVDTGEWAPVPDTMTYQWFRDGVSIPGATQPTYALSSADIGAHFTATVVAEKAGFQSITMQAGADRRVIFVPAPTITGQNSIGKVLTAVTAAWQPGPVPMIYQWYRNGIPIPGATSVTYQLAAADAGKSVTVEAIGYIWPPNNVTRLSAPFMVGGLLTTKTPTISGTAVYGNTLTANPGTWGPGTVTFKYQWNRNGAAIGGATGRTYKLGWADTGTTITVTVTGNRSGYAPAPKTSAGKAIQKAVTATTPKLTGAAKAGSTVTASRGTWGPSGISIRHQWYRDGRKISGATKSTYKVTNADKGLELKVKVTGSKSGYTTVTRTSAGKIVSPGNMWNCEYFSSQASAQRWFDRYYPDWGDVARLDPDNDRIACETYPYWRWR
jgi:hypothetical protein